MSLEEHIKTSKKLYENEQKKSEEEKIHREESVKRENKLRREREQRDKEYEIRRLENKNYAVFKEDQTGLFGIGRLFAETLV